MRLLGPVLQAALQELDLAELQEERRSQGGPLYCRGLFDAITVGGSHQLVCFWLLPCLLTPVCLFSPPDQNQTVFVFRANVYWTVSTEGRVGGPLPLLRRWSHLPAAIEAAAFSPPDSKWYFFKGAGLTPNSN